MKNHIVGCILLFCFHNNSIIIIIIYFIKGKCIAVSTNTDKPCSPCPDQMSRIAVGAEWTRYNSIHSQHWIGLSQKNKIMLYSEYWILEDFLKLIRSVQAANGKWDLLQMKAELVGFNIWLNLYIFFYPIRSLFHFCIMCFCRLKLVGASPRK